MCCEGMCCVRVCVCYECGYAMSEGVMVCVMRGAVNVCCARVCVFCKGVGVFSMKV